MVVTSNPAHPAFQTDADNLHIIYQERQDLPDALRPLPTRLAINVARAFMSRGGKN